MISAAEEVPPTADPNDVTFGHPEDGFVYHFVLAATTGKDVYDLTVTEREAGGVDVSLYM